MITLDAHTLLTVLILMFGCGLFLRMVGKEKRRRERHLELRAEEMLNAQAESERLEMELEKVVEDLEAVTLEGPVEEARPAAA